MSTPTSSRPPAAADRMTGYDLRSLMPMTAEIRDGHLWIGGVDMVELAHEAGTALYVMDEATIRHQLAEYVKWTRYHWPDVDVVYAGKALLTLAMTRIVAEEDCCLLCASGGELAYAVRAGFPMERRARCTATTRLPPSSPSVSMPASGGSWWTTSRRWSASRRSPRTGVCASASSSA